MHEGFYGFPSCPGSLDISPVISSLVTLLSQDISIHPRLIWQTEILGWEQSCHATFHSTRWPA
jgi:hypothetical protein